MSSVFFSEELMLGNDGIENPVDEKRWQIGTHNGHGERCHDGIPVLLQLVFLLDFGTHELAEVQLRAWTAHIVNSVVEGAASRLKQQCLTKIVKAYVEFEALISN